MPRGIRFAEAAIVAAVVALWFAPPSTGAEPFPDRFVWVFGWNLNRDADVAAIQGVLDTGAAGGLNGAMFSLGLDTLCKKDADYFRRLKEVRAACDRQGIAFIPAIFSVGYGGAALAHDRNLAEGLPVDGATFVAEGSAARFVPDESVALVNGGFEEFSGNRVAAMRFHDQPGEVSFCDTDVRHSGGASLRMENFQTNPHGHGRVMQAVKVQPHRCYRIGLWVKTEGLQPAGALKIQVLADNRTLAPHDFSLPETADWRRITMLFNSLDKTSVNLYAGVWNGRSGKFWLDDWTLEEVGPLNVLNRPGTPVRVQNADGTVTFEEGRDYARLEDPQYSPYRIDREPPELKLISGGEIREGSMLRVNWYHSLAINESQVTVCMAEPKLYEIFDHEAALLAQHVRPQRVMLNMDEIRMGGTCAACRDHNMGELLGSCITRQVEILRRHLPGVQVYIWSDMLDPNHNARGDYYLVQGDFTGSWNHVPRDLVIAVWGGEPREKSLRFFADQGFETLAACYYDADDLRDVKGWLQLAREQPRVRGLMYTPWQKKYALLGEFGNLLNAP